MTAGGSSLPAAPDHAAAAADALYHGFWKGAGVFGKSRENMPEYWHLRGVAPADRVSVLTVAATMDYQTDAETLWRAAAATYHDPGTRWLFDMPRAAQAEPERVRQAMAVHGFTGRYPANNAGYVQRVCRTFARLYGGHPAGLFERYGHDALALFRSRTRLGDLPALTGKKIFPLWLRILKDVGGVPLRNVERVPIPVDVHTARATYRLLYGRADAPDVGRDGRRIAEDWFSVCRSLGRPEVYPLALDEPLWFLSREGCSGTDGRATCPRVAQCVVGRFCVFSRAAG